MSDDDEHGANLGSQDGYDGGVLSDLVDCTSVSMQDIVQHEASHT